MAKGTCIIHTKEAMHTRVEQLAPWCTKVRSVGHILRGAAVVRVGVGLPPRGAQLAPLPADAQARLHNLRRLAFASLRARGQPVHKVRGEAPISKRCNLKQMLFRG